MHTQYGEEVVLKKYMRPHPRASSEVRVAYRCPNCRSRPKLCTAHVEGSDTSAIYAHCLQCNYALIAPMRKLNRDFYVISTALKNALVACRLNTKVSHLQFVALFTKEIMAYRERIPLLHSLNEWTLISQLESKFYEEARQSKTIMGIPLDYYLKKVNNLLLANEVISL